MSKHLQSCQLHRHTPFATLASPDVPCLRARHIRARCDLLSLFLA